ncbi:MAG: O-antigen ligase family protein, partial [Lachnospiraceae bacterium]
TLLFALMLPALLFYLISNLRAKTWRNSNFSKIFAKFSLIDRFVSLYLLACFVTFLLSPYQTFQFFGADASNPAWTGYSGWFMGFKSQLMFIVLYFLISRFFMKSWKTDLLIALTGASAIVFLFGILHRFLIDPLSLYEEIDSYYYALFLSTIGQSTWYSSYLCTVFPIGLFLFWHCDKRWQRILLGIYSAIGFASLVTQNSDSAYFALAAFLSVLFAFSFQSVKSLRRFLEVLLIGALSMRLIGIFQLLFPDRAIPVDKLSAFFSQNPFLWIAIFILVLLYFLLVHLEVNGRFQIESVVCVRRLGLFLIAAAIPVGLLCIVLTTTGHLPAFLSSFERFGYFIFDENWGNGRGFTWKYCISMFAEYPLKLKLFGVGSDCFASYTYDYHADFVAAKWGESVLANAHNEWMNMLLTTGIFGLVTYTGIFISSFVLFIREQKNSIFLLAAAGSIGSYFFHNLFCYQQVMCTPFIFLIIGLGEFVRREHAGKL